MSRIIFLLLLITVVSCRPVDNFMPDAYRTNALRDYARRHVIPSDTRSFLDSLLITAADDRVAACMRFLYAYMPLNDIADYNVSFFLDNTSYAVRSRDEFPWGKDIPAEIFFNFVLPVRVNNENLDSFRIVYYDELRNRVSGLRIREAALEINRWCHERVTYQPSDIRTSSPMATMLSARGRCGEESVFTVAALRTAGIPARQVYTPRWAHTDDNHAWVEIWADGEWYYLGACEPEPVLDRGWFTEPARRAMLVHTKAFGFYDGDEMVIRREPWFTEINNLGKYAVTKPVVVRVEDENGNPAEGVIVDFCLYNYAEFYPIARVTADISGYACFTTGIGDLLVWAGRDDKSGFSFIPVAETDTVTITLGKTHEGEMTVVADLNVPEEPEPFPAPDENLMLLNKKLVARGDSIREAYIGSWITPGEADTLAVSLGYESSRVVPLIMKSQGNYREITAFLSLNSGEAELASQLLGQLSEKDLRDAKEEVLTDHLENVMPYDAGSQGFGYNIYLEYLLNPRVANELLTGWRGTLKSIFAPGSDIISRLPDACSVIETVNAMVNLNDKENYYGTPITPSGVAATGLADTWSARIFAVAALRASGIPARLEPGTNIPQYFESGKWIDVVSPFVEKRPRERALVTLKQGESSAEPRYYFDFTLARFSSGRYHTLTYDYNRRLSEFDTEMEVTPGNYMLVTGNRIDDSRILAAISFFPADAGSHKTVTVSPRQGSMIMISENVINSELLQDNTGDGRKKPFLAIWMNPETEPAKHLLNDLPRYGDLFGKWEGNIYIFTPDEASLGKLMSRREILPGKAIIEVDSSLTLMAAIGGETVASDPHRLPYVILADQNGKVLYNSSGYKIGTAGQIAGRLK